MPVVVSIVGEVGGLGLDDQLVLDHRPVVFVYLRLD